MGPQSEPEDVLAWLVPDDGRQTTDIGKRDRVFDEVPRVMRCVDPRKAVVFFNPSDNPYGNPKEVMADLRHKAKAYVRERFYGMAEKTISVLIPKFNRNIHVIPANRIPTSGTNYFFMDPAAERNCFMSWFRIKGQNVYLYREWPGNYAVPGIGIPGPWAIPSGRKDGRNDGAPGEGQQPSFGFGNLRYKFEMARLERWADYKLWSERSEINQPTERYPADEDLTLWRYDYRDAAEEMITMRYIDSRAASAPRIENDRPVTLQTDFDDINILFNLTPGADIADGVSKINSALDYEEGVNAPHFFISADCENSIYALENWMNADGQNGACKDPIDLIRYFFMAECEDVGVNDYRERGGVAYGGQGVGVRGANRIYKGKRKLPI